MPAHCPLRPVAEDVLDPRTFGQSEGEIEVRPPVAGRLRQRPHLGAGDHTLVRTGHPNHRIPHPVTFVDAEHAESSVRAVGHAHLGEITWRRARRAESRADAV